jgi:hypothetical protein
MANVNGQLRMTNRSILNIGLFSFVGFSFYISLS